MMPEGWQAEFAWLSTAFSDYKTLLERSIGFHNDALHVIAGIALQIVAALILRRSLAHWAPWVTVTVFEIANEVNDVFSEQWPDAATQMGEGIKDLILTIAIPTVIFATANWMPSLYRKDSKSGPNPSD